MSIEELCKGYLTCITYSLTYTRYQIFYVKNMIMKNIHQRNSHHVKREIQSTETFQSTRLLC
jgi:hypothetical protein